MMIKLFFVLSLVALFSTVIIIEADASHFTIPIPQDDHIPGMRKSSLHPF